MRRYPAHVARQLSLAQSPRPQFMAELHLAPKTPEEPFFLELPPGGDRDDRPQGAASAMGGVEQEFATPT